MSTPTLERVYELGCGLIGWASRRHGLSRAFFEDQLQDWIIGHCRDGTIPVADDEACRAHIKKHFRDRAIDYRRWRGRIEVLNDFPAAGSDDTWGSVTAVDDELANDQRVQDALIRDFLAELRPVEQSVFWLVKGEGLSHRQAASRLGITRSDVLVMLRRAGELLDRVVIVYAHGRWCEKRRTELDAVQAAGADAGEQAVEGARWHLGQCLACQVEFRVLHRRFTRGALGLITPIPLIVDPRLLEHVHASGEQIRSMLSGLRGRVSDSISHLNPYLAGSTDTAERTFTAGKTAIVALCAAGAATAGVCTLAGVPTPLIAQDDHPRRPRSERRVTPRLAPPPPPPVVVPPPQKASPPRPAPRISPRPKPAAPPPGGTELGPTSGGTPAKPPPAPANSLAAELGP